MGKLKTPAFLSKEITRLKDRGKKIVFTNGCFDILHPGHLKILKQAKKFGDILIVGLNSDLSVRKIKGKKRPILNEKARAQILEAIDIVDFIVLFKEATPYLLIKKIKPDILVKGGDWKKQDIVGNDIAGKVCRVKIYPGYSTTAIINKIKRAG